MHNGERVQNVETAALLVIGSNDAANAILNSISIENSSRCASAINGVASLDTY